MKAESRQDIISVFGNSFGEDDITSVREVMRSHLVGAGEVTARFEDAFKNKIGFRHAAAVSSCTNGFWLLLRALDFQQHDEIIMPSIHFHGIKGVLELLNIKCSIVDVGKPVPNITLKAIKGRLNKNTRAIIFLEYGGYPVSEIAAIRRYLKGIGRADIHLILDAANSPFTRYRGQYTARKYDHAVYSFDMNKILVTGDGGMVLSDNKLVVEKVKSLSFFGLADAKRTGFARSESGALWWVTGSVIPSLKLVMNNLAAAIGLAQLNRVDRFLARRAQIIAEYHKSLKPLAREGLMGLPPELNGLENNVYFFWLMLKDMKTRNNLARYLLGRNIYSTVKYQPLSNNAAAPNAHVFFNRSLLLPLNQNLTGRQQKHIVNSIYDFFNHEH